MAELPALTAAEMARVEEKLVAAGLAKLNSGLTPAKLEMEAIERAGERGREPEMQAPEERLEVTELGLEVHVSDALEKRGIHDASRLLEKHKKVFEIIAAMLARNVPVRDICDICRVSPCTVQSVAEHPAANLTAVTQKDHFIAKLRLAASLGLEAIIKRFQAGEATAVELGIVVDKLALAEGGVTSRTEVIHRDEDEDEWTRLVERTRTGMVIEAEEIPPKPALRAPELLENASNDIQSLDIDAQTFVNQ